MKLWLPSFIIIWYVFKKDVVEFEDIFDHVHVANRNTWIFCLNKPQGKECQDRNAHVELSGKHDYMILRLRHFIHFSIEF